MKVLQIQIEMERMEKIREFFESGRYEYDLFFYESLLQIMEELGIFADWEQIKKNIEVISEIKKITKQHLYLLQEYDTEEEALKLANKSKEYLQKVNIKIVKEVMKNIQEMKGESFQEKINKMIKKSEASEQFVGIVDKVNKSVHDNKLRLEENLKIALFINKNRSEIQKYVNLYKKIIGNGLSELKEFRTRAQFIVSNPEIGKNPKVRGYIKGSFIMVNVLIHFNEIYKLIGKNSSFSLKLKSLQKQIQSRYNRISNEKINSHEIPFNEVKQMLKRQSYSQIQVCQYCLRKSEDHNECVGVIKLLQDK